MHDVPLIIKQRMASDVVVLDLTGRLWILDLPLRDRMASLLAEKHKFFVLNIAGVNYIDSSGLGQLVAIWSSIRNRGGNLTLLNPNKRILKLFEITKLYTVFDIFENENDAVQRARLTSEASA